MRFKLIACEIFYREACLVTSRSLNQVDIEFLPKGLHDLGREGMYQRLQATISRVDEGRYDAVLLAYGLCNNGIVGLGAKTIPLVVPRVHDCIGVFFGCARRYLDYFQEQPGVYFTTTGWIERNELGDLQQLSIQHNNKIDLTYEEFVARYGEDNARYLWEQLGDPTRHYRHLAFIEMGVEPDDRFERCAREIAAERSWTFEKISGDLSWLQRLVDGDWKEGQFLVVPPGGLIRASFDDTIIAVEEAREPG